MEVVSNLQSKKIVDFPVQKKVSPLGDFFYCLVYRSSDPNFCILEKKKLFWTVLIFSDVKNCQI